MSSCLGSDTLLAWVEGTLPAAARTAAIAHIAGCARCREATSALARAAPTRDGRSGADGSGRSGPPAAADVAPRAWLPGTSLGRYRIEGRIAQGGMGVVLIAHDPTLQRKVAIKVSRPAGAVRAAALEARLIQEARALARLRHPNIVAVYDTGRDGDDLFLVQELIVGESMRAWLAHRHRWHDALRICISAGRGLEALHRAGLAHRDVKPENILLATDGRIVLVDLGLAIRTDGAGPPLTARGAVVGTPRYMAPEQLAGSRGDARSDQYAFALVVREALMSADPPAPPSLRAAIGRAMDPDPAFRYSSMTELLAALARAAKPRPWRRPAVLATGGASALGLAALLYGAVRLADSPSAPPSPPSAVSPSPSASSPPSSTTSPSPSPAKSASPPPSPAPAVPSPAPPRSSPKTTPSPSPPPPPALSPSLAAIAEAERQLGLHVRPADYDPAHFDPSKYLVVARDLARSVVDDVELTLINLEPVMPDGTVDLRMSANYGYYSFRSPSRSKLPEGAAPNVSMRRKCEVMVYVEPTRITAQEVNTTECHRPVGPLPRCTFAQLRAKLLQLGAPADLAGKITWSVKHGWDFSTDLGQPFRSGEKPFKVSLPDDC